MTEFLPQSVGDDKGTGWTVTIYTITFILVHFLIRLAFSDT